MRTAVALLIPCYFLQNWPTPPPHITFCYLGSLWKTPVSWSINVLTLFKAKRSFLGWYSNVPTIFEKGRAFLYRNSLFTVSLLILKWVCSPPKMRSPVTPACFHFNNNLYYIWPLCGLFSPWECSSWIICAVQIYFLEIQVISPKHIFVIFPDDFFFHNAYFKVIFFLSEKTKKSMLYQLKTDVVSPMHFGHVKG